MRKGSPEAKAWGRKMQRMRGSKTRRSRSTRRLEKVRRKRPDTSRGIKVLPDIIELGGLGYGASQAYAGDTTRGAEIAAGAVVLGEALKYVGKHSKIGRKLHKTHRILGIKVKAI